MSASLTEANVLADDFEAQVIARFTGAAPLVKYQCDVLGLPF